MSQTRPVLNLSEEQKQALANEIAEAAKKLEEGGEKVLEATLVGIQEGALNEAEDKGVELGTEVVDKVTTALSIESSAASSTTPNQEETQADQKIEEAAASSNNESGELEAQPPVHEEAAGVGLEEPAPVAEVAPTVEAAAPAPVEHSMEELISKIETDPAKNPIAFVNDVLQIIREQLEKKHKDNAAQLALREGQLAKAIYICEIVGQEVEERKQKGVTFSARQQVNKIIKGFDKLIIPQIKSPYTSNLLGWMADKVGLIKPEGGLLNEGSALLKGIEAIKSDSRIQAVLAAPKVENTKLSQSMFYAQKLELDRKLANQEKTADAKVAPASPGSRRG